MKHVSTTVPFKLKPIRVVVQNDQDGEELVIEDRGGGIDIRNHLQPVMMAAESTTVDLPMNHCKTCRDGLGLVELVGLSDDEFEDLRHWREAKKRGVTPKRLGEVLDKLIAALQKPEASCDDPVCRVVVKVEAVDG